MRDGDSAIFMPDNVTNKVIIRYNNGGLWILIKRFVDVLLLGGANRRWQVPGPDYMEVNPQEEY